MREKEWFDYNSLFEAINDCDGVFYTAALLSDDPTYATNSFFYRNKSEKWNLYIFTIVPTYK